MVISTEASSEGPPKRPDVMWVLQPLSPSAGAWSAVRRRTAAERVLMMLCELCVVDS